ncbi:hypothetical protein QBC40DRAFT_290971 [Triangularia verruculosa]|uniref:Uncharacterized protein n=1 Tax=Triangularia verruculosa TaxID=2587418 RepID=A0AAN6X5A3_9PEZI|nr:hypothetical protein QBC40DRAFT_290971 [Triangularia verruculosa]
MATHTYPDRDHSAKSTPYTDAALNPPSLLPRRFFSLILIVLLYTAASPFTPISWALGSDTVYLSGTYLFDRLFSGLILFAAFYFQWRIASLRASVAVTLPLGGSTTQVRNGRLETVHSSSMDLFLFKSSDYWHFALAEAGVLLLAEFAGGESLRRVVVTLTVAGVWLVGWAATPRSVKNWMWEHAKAYLFVLVLDELRAAGRGFIGGGHGMGGRRRRH